jgi:hypothetical protein
MVIKGCKIRRALKLLDLRKKTKAPVVDKKETLRIIVKYLFGKQRVKNEIKNNYINNS